jgi:hypothetical protein
MLKCENFDLKNMKTFTQEIVNHVDNLLKEIDMDNLNEIKLFEFFVFLADLCKNDFPENFEEIIFMNIKLVCGDKLIPLFENFWEVLIRTKIDLPTITKFKDISKFFKFCFKDDYFTPFDKFNFVISKILKNLKANEFIASLNNILSIYPVVNLLAKIFFDEFYYINREKDLLKNLISELKSENEESVVKLKNMILKDNQIEKNENIIQIQKILLISKTQFEIFNSLLLKAVKQILKLKNSEIFSDLKLLIYFYFSDLFVNKYLKSSNYKAELKPILNEIILFKSKTFSLAIHKAIQLQNNTKLNFIYEYLDILDDMPSFENYYTELLLERALGNSFNKEYEKEIIEKILAMLRDKLMHSYKLQTTINSIKIVNKSLMNIVGIPTHCYHLINIGCKPILDLSMLNLFEDNKINSLPTNSVLTPQQGFVHFKYKKNEFIVNPLQYSLILNIKNGFDTIKLIEKEFNYTESLVNFLLENLLKSGLIQILGDKFIINCKFPDNNTLIDLKCDILNYNENKNEDFSDKHYLYVLDCYIIRFLKKSKSANFDKIKNEIQNLNFMKNNLNEKTIFDRLDDLVNKELIKLENQIYSYI